MKSLILTLVIFAAMSGTTAYSAEHSHAKEDALFRCAYFPALFFIGYRFTPEEVREVILTNCKSQIIDYAATVDPAYLKRQSELEMCGNSPCLTITGPSDEPDLGYSMIIINQVINQYREALSNLN